jgi:hypothetical protein
MLIVGYREPVDWSKVKASFKKCTTMTATDIDRVVKQIRNAQTVQLEDDFILHAELRDLNILVK